MIRHLLLVGCAFALAGCGYERANPPRSSRVSQGDWPASSDYAVNKDAYQKSISLSGPDVVVDDWQPSKVLLRTKSGDSYFFRQIYFTLRTADDWTFFDRVVTDGGVSLETHKINQQVDGASCVWCREEIAADLPDALFTKALTEGLSLRVYGQRGTKDFDIPAAYMQAYAAKEKEAIPSRATAP